MAYAKYRYTLDECAWVNSDYIGGWGAFDGYSGEIDFPLDELAYELQSAHLDHDRERDRVTLSYGVTENGKQKIIREHSNLERVPCHYGGSRVYFRAPCCGERVRVLVLLPGGVRCIRHGSVTYASRRKNGVQRLIHKADMLAGKLECDSWYASPAKRPKGMRRETFDRLADEHAALVREVIGIIQPRLARASRRGQMAYWGALLRAGL